MEICLAWIIRIKRNARNRCNVLETRPDLKHFSAVLNVIQSIATPLNRHACHVLPEVLLPGEGAVRNMPVLRGIEDAIHVCEQSDFLASQRHGAVGMRPILPLAIGARPGDVERVGQLEIDAVRRQPGNGQRREDAATPDGLGHGAIATRAAAGLRITLQGGASQDGATEQRPDGEERQQAPAAPGPDLRRSTGRLQ